MPDPHPASLAAAIKAHHSYLNCDTSPSPNKSTHTQISSSQNTSPAQQPSRLTRNKVSNMSPSTAVKEFAHHPLAGAQPETSGPYAGETRVDAWLLQHSKFLRGHVKHEEHFENEPANVKDTSFSGLGAHKDSVDTSATTATEPTAAAVPTETGELEEPNHNGNEAFDSEWHAKNERRGTGMKALRKAFWYNGNK